MKVLHLPYNIANWASINVNALNKIDNIEAKAIVFGEKNILHSHDNITYISQKNKIQTLKSIIAYRKHIKWADVVHWYYDDKILPYNIALNILKKYNKPCVVEWLGSDIRNPIIDFKDNKYFKSIYPLLYSETPKEVQSRTLALQTKFGNYGFSSITSTDINQYLIENLYSKNYILKQRIDVKSIPEPKIHFDKSNIKICHAPSNKDVKGTKFIIDAVDKLKQDGYNFEFDLIHNTSHKEALGRINQSDIFIDQLILGGHGMAALEALSMNKVVICYLKEYAIHKYPNDHPIINANPINIYQILKNLILNPNKIIETKQLGQKYVLKYHDTEKLTPNLINIYKEVISLKDFNIRN
jgi:hypothetical protein